MSDRFGSDRSGVEGADVDDLLGAFALDAVDPEERVLVEHRLARDPVARAEVDEMRETAASLAALPTDSEGAPDGLWGRIADAIGSPVVLPSGAEPSTPRASHDVVRFMRSRRSFPSRIVMPVAAAAAILIAVLVVGLAGRAPNRAGDLAAAYNHAVDTGATTVALQPDVGNGQVTAEIAWKSDGTGYLRNEHLGALPAGKTYQLWATYQQGNRQRAISAGVLGRDVNAAAFHVVGSPTAFAITVEDAPGVVASRQTPVAIGEVPASST
jgi:Anti-sigma-K factor rskA